jgi:two-component system phosphate regulon sensor histidine kinase PhoR
VDKKFKLVRRAYVSYLIVIIVSVTAMAWFASAAIKNLYFQRAFEELKVRALLVERFLQGKFSSENKAEIDAFCKQVGPLIDTEITVILPSGAVIGDSWHDTALMESHGRRPEVKEALAGEVGRDERYSAMSQANMIFLALPVKKNGQLVAVVRTGMPVDQMAVALKSVYIEIGIAGLIIALLGAAGGFYVSRRISSGIADVTKGAARFAHGDPDYKLDVPDSEELGYLAETLNQVADQLHMRINTIAAQRNELQGVLSSMLESVLVIDTDECIMRVNRAAEKLFSLDRKKVIGRSVREAIRNTELYRFVAKTLAGSEPVEGDIVFLGEPERFLQAHGSPLKNERNECIGALVVVNDVTRLKNLENVRRDFVTNVSHELKTPITSIKGFLETLKEGAMEDPGNRERFLDIIIKHTDRLSMIIDDLLSLSRIEQDSERGTIALEESLMTVLFEAVGKLCAKKAEEKNLRLQFICDSSLTAMMNPILLEQALFNLVDNAIKYSDPGATIIVDAEKTADEVVIRVVDEGCGIPKDHLERIFERFYRVDKARSRKEGGTGLGLAIVKHIVNAHNGRIEVQSTPGKGSTFSVHLPLLKE